MNTLQRLWAGIVAAEVSAAFAVLAQFVGREIYGLPTDYFEWIMLICGCIGFFLGMAKKDASLTHKRIFLAGLIFLAFLLSIIIVDYILYPPWNALGPHPIF